LFFGIPPFGEGHVTCAAQSGAGLVYTHENFVGNSWRKQGVKGAGPLKLAQLPGAKLVCSLAVYQALPALKRAGHLSRGFHV